ncbi:hypothetical protein SDC9_209926 [bioreactor metagenome]|uniref:Uncharacterized protein n=1 Tax=bioreactor metagenome TaxID=1076179 RepID=A0A645JHK8_9ZZZZ
MEVISVICFLGGTHQTVIGRKRPAVQLGQVTLGNNIVIGVKIRQVADHKPGRVTDLAVGFRELFQNFFADAHIDLIIRRCNP